MSTYACVDQGGMAPLKIPHIRVSHFDTYLESET